MSFAAATREAVHLAVETFVLVFLIITFEVQAFVIPTGSLAPTLLGRHRSVVCPRCAYPFQVGTSEEVDRDSGAAKGPGYRVEGCTCPMCRYPIDLRPDRSDQLPSSSGGERILVSRFAYQIAEPQRWDIGPFKYPGGATKNYIKRIVGLPGETVRIHRGEILVRSAGEDAFRIARKPPKKALAMAQIVYDNDYVVPEMIRRGWPARWGPSPTSAASGNWVVSDDYRSFQTGGSAGDEIWVRYRHFVPSYLDWQRLQSDPPPRGFSPRPRLIDDFCAYNTSRTRESIDEYSAPGLESIGMHWVGDLLLQCAVEVQSTEGEIILELIEGGRAMRCRVDVATGAAGLSIGGLESFRPTGKTGIRGRGTYEIVFANVDDRLMLWVDGDLVPFDGPTSYGPLYNHRPQAADLSPAGIASRGAALRISHLKLFRDIYYSAGRGIDSTGILCDYRGPILPFRLNPDEVAGFLGDPRRWWAFDAMHTSEFPLGEDQFLMLGDNSSRSQDSRLWGREGLPYYVSRNLLLGKALVVFWPRSPGAIRAIPGVEIPFPNFSHLRSVR